MATNRKHLQPWCWSIEVFAFGTLVFLQQKISKPEAPAANDPPAAAAPEAVPAVPAAPATAAPPKVEVEGPKVDGTVTLETVWIICLLFTFLAIMTGFHSLVY